MWGVCAQSSRAMRSRGPLGATGLQITRQPWSRIRGRRPLRLLLCSLIPRAVLPAPAGQVRQRGRSRICALEPRQPRRSLPVFARSRRQRRRRRSAPSSASRSRPFSGPAASPHRVWRPSWASWSRDFCRSRLCLHLFRHAPRSYRLLSWKRGGRGPKAFCPSLPSPISSSLRRIPCCRWPLLWRKPSRSVKATRSSMVLAPPAPARGCAAPLRATR